MTQIVWDNVGERYYETGVDRGVLFTSDGTAVPWNGLTSLSEDASDTTVTPYYIDGVKYLDDRTYNDFSATLKAFTYPDEFLPYDGYVVTEEGLTLTDQPVNDLFGLSYRTLVSNDEDPNLGYRIHFLYNLTAKADAKAYDSTENVSKPIEFSWSLTGIPVPYPQHRPLVHIYIDTRNITDYQLEAVEEYLYGTDTTDPKLPLPVDILSIVHLASAPTFLFDGGAAVGDLSTDIIFDGGTP